ncbi:hypothetical protein [Absidia glauca]|uniref:RanBP2-type domain-containing protein n=1 Tax=Absidia glauca TaxID=4829 RepID=A0A163LR78_ABSGL|nr:hypothetical protein [Absidia glauca]
MSQYREGELGKHATKYNGLFSEKDWKCTFCNNINWAKRDTCNQCNNPKPGSNLAAGRREGAGGGFMERQDDDDTTRRRRQQRYDDGDEWDEFGRRIKKPSSASSSNKSTETTRRQEEQHQHIDDDDDDDDDDGGKYSAWNDILSEDEGASNEVPSLVLGLP